MKSFAKTAASFFGLFIVLFFFVFGAYAQSNYSNVLASNTNLSKRILPLKSTTSSILMLAQLDEQNSATQIQKEFVEKRQLEEWMFDEYFWQVVVPIWNEKATDEHKEIEPWMVHMKLSQYGSVISTENKKDKIWLQKHSFFIL